MSDSVTVAAASPLSYAAYLRWCIQNAGQLPGAFDRMQAWWNARGVVDRWAAIREFGDFVTPIFATFPHDIVETMSADDVEKLEAEATAAVQAAFHGDGRVKVAAAFDWSAALKRLFELLVKLAPLLS